MPRFVVTQRHAFVGHTMHEQFGAALVVVAAIATSACGVTTHHLMVQAATTNMAQLNGAPDPSHGCTPPSPVAPLADVRWNAEPPSNKSLLAVGFEVWRNTADQGACTEHRETAYRGIIQYDLTNVIPVKDTLGTAQLSFSSKILPSGVTPSASNLCDPHQGGLGSLFEVNAPLQPLASNMIMLQGIIASAPGTPATFPAGTRLVAFPIPWVAGPIGNNASTAASGTGGASFTVDVTSRVQNALAAGKTEIQFMLSGSDEAFPRPIPPPSSIDCRTLYQVNALDVAYLGN
jgi:hypothetical protein